MAVMLQPLPLAHRAPCPCLERKVRSWQTQAARRRRQTAAKAGSSDEERDLSAQWAQFVDSAKKGMPEVESRERAGARWNDSRAPNWARESFRQQADSRRQSIEAQENRVLDFWLTPGFYKAAAASVVVLLAVLLLSGPP